MLNRLFAAFQGAPQDETAAPQMEPAIAALLVEAARADDIYTEDEKHLIDTLLSKRFALSADAAADLRARAEIAQAEANDLYGFSHIVKSELDREGKMSLVEDLWRIVLSDGDRDPHEEMLIRRLVGLIYLEDRDSALARQRAEKALESGQ
ncbi:hypothetical protein PB2503_01372 [Parvularcula bermudensis HTCC2503]|uniref:Co-chaperone DjlA N-terminal domain-containing protein n=1 Tax=Parvularcula bermudensis (strain ATCC BAA-594 / HTCC2503 / KCTC 12087) TaxID=314260 RepID=E0TBH8_PARBH|nr:TerB family tellurite resistance protein [Parvularcula bermudensis]ADM08353.1 hypothetical protein PB2503_01372 [Parvularcula bermudensis HTCC2503]